MSSPRPTTHPTTRSFASDNNSGIHPTILKAIEEANRGQVPAYGDDPFTIQAISSLKKAFGAQTDPYFVFNGTGANVLSLTSLVRSYHAVICSDLAHIAVDECGAPEKFLGSKLVTVSCPNGKLTVDLIQTQLKGIGDQHHVQPKVLSVTQSTEYGTVYTVDEVRELCKFAKKSGLHVHMDGARLSNAATSLGLSLKEATFDLGVDVLSFGGTKNGLMNGEVVIFATQELSKYFKFIRKQGMQLASKMRFLAAQYEALLINDLWKQNAIQANSIARFLADQLNQKVPMIKITQPVQANAVFAILPKPAIMELQKEFFFYIWNESQCEVRWMTSFDTTEGDVIEFVEAIRRALTPR